MEEKFCTNPDCGKPIRVTIFLDSGFCSVDCRKAVEGEGEPRFMAMLTRKELGWLAKRRDKKRA